MEDNMLESIKREMATVKALGRVLGFLLMTFRKPLQQTIKWERGVSYVAGRVVMFRWWRDHA